MFGEETTVSKKSPITTYADWKSKAGKMEMWSKDLGQSIEFEPAQFVVVDKRSVIKGWNDSSGSKIYSNSVKRLKDEEFVVKAFKSEKPLYTGTYDRTKIEDIGGYLCAEYLVLEGGTLNAYYFKGSAMKDAGDAIDAIDTNNYYVKFAGAETKKKGSVTYTTPKFVQGDKISDKDRNEAIAFVEQLKEYYA